MAGAREFCRFVFLGMEWEEMVHASSGELGVSENMVYGGQFHDGGWMDRNVIDLVECVDGMNAYTSVLLLCCVYSKTVKK